MGVKSDDGGHRSEYAVIDTCTKAPAVGASLIPNVTRGSMERHHSATTFDTLVGAQSPYEKRSIVAAGSALADRIWHTADSVQIPGTQG
jgi:hypothetical protein